MEACATVRGTDNYNCIIRPTCMHSRNSYAEKASMTDTICTGPRVNIRGKMKAVWHLLKHSVEHAANRNDAQSIYRPHLHESHCPQAEPMGP